MTVGGGGRPRRLVRRTGVMGVLGVLGVLGGVEGGVEGGVVDGRVSEEEEGEIRLESLRKRLERSGKEGGGIGEENTENLFDGVNGVLVAHLFIMLK